MTEWSPTRRELLGVAGVGGTPVASWGNVTDAVPEHPFVPAADERWSHDLGDSAFLTGPVDDTFYARTSGVVHAIATDGTRRWRFEIESTYPSVQVGRQSPYRSMTRTVYVNDDDRVYALDPEDGDVRWRYEDVWRPSVAATSPGLVVVFDDERVGYDDALVGLRAADGSERWRIALDDGIWLAPHYDEENLYVGTTEGTFYAVGLDDGEVHWQVEPLGDGEDAPNESRFVAVDSTADLAFAWHYDEGTLYALESDDGSERWRFDTGRDEAGFPGTVRDDTVYLTDEGTLRAISTADGSERWRFEPEAELSWIPQVFGDAVYVGTRNAVHAVSVGTGRERWRSGTGAVPAGVTDGTLVCDSLGTRIYGFSTADGSERWQYDPGESLSLPPVVREDAIYFGTQSGTLTALSEPGPTPVSDALRTVVSPAGLAVGGLLGGALAAGAYRRRSRAADASGAPEASAVGDDSTTTEDFELVRSIAEADHAEVHEARAPDGTRVALKRLREGEIAREDFEAAVSTWADLDVPGVLDVRERGFDPVPWIATEYATNGHLGAKAADLTVEERVRVVADAAETVHRAHREGVTHGRLVPGNVLFSTDGVRVGDWRLAAELRDPPEGYAPPESDPGLDDADYEIAGPDDADSEDVDFDDASPEAADVYQLAAMARELLAGDDHNAKEATEVLSRALAADPDDRHDSALKFADALRWALRE